MLLHRYFAGHVFETLRDKRLKVSRISTFNDPFEVMYIPAGSMDRETARKYVSTNRYLNSLTAHLQKKAPGLSREVALRQAKGMRTSSARKLLKDFEAIKELSLKRREEMTDRIIRVACFTDPAEVNPRDDILMWSHYGDKHTGLRVGFEFPPGIKFPFFVEAVNYSDKRVELDLTLIATNPDLFREQLRASNKTKSLAWSYEKEYRLFTQPKICAHERLTSGEVLDFVPIDTEWVKRIDFGAKHPAASREKVIDLVTRAYSHVSLFKSMYHPTDYALTYEPILIAGGGSARTSK